MVDDRRHHISSVYSVARTYCSVARELIVRGECSWIHVLCLQKEDVEIHRFTYMGNFAEILFDTPLQYWDRSKPREDDAMEWRT